MSDRDLLEKIQGIQGKISEMEQTISQLSLSEAALKGIVQKLEIGQEKGASASEIEELSSLIDTKAEEAAVEDLQDTLEANYFKHEDAEGMREDFEIQFEEFKDGIQEQFTSCDNNTEKMGQSL